MMDYCPFKHERVGNPAATCEFPHCIEKRPQCHEADIRRQAGELRQRPGDQPLPIKNTQRYCQDVLIERISGSYYGPNRDVVIADVERRKQLGIQRYGTALQPHNGRDFLRDTYEEALDTSIYIEGELVEARDANRHQEVATLTAFQNDVLRLVFYLKHLMSKREESQSSK